MPQQFITGNEISSTLSLTGNTAISNLAYSGTFTGSTGVLNIGSGQIYKDSSGNVGIGVTPSGWSLAGGTALQSTAGAIASYSTGQFLSVANAYYNAGWKYVNSSLYATQYQQASGQHTWYTAPSGTAGSAITFTQAMTLDANGVLLIGATSPQNGKLYVGAGDSNGWYSQFGSTSTGVLVGIRSSTASIGTVGAASLALNPDGGNVGIGVTNMASSSLSLAESKNLQWSWSSNGYTYASIFNQSSSAALVLSSGYQKSANTNAFASSVPVAWSKSATVMNGGTIQFYTDTSSTVAVGTDITPTERMRIDSSGNVGIGNVSPQFRLEIDQNSAAATPSQLLTPTLYLRGYAGASNIHSGIGFAMHEHTNGYWGSAILSRDDTGSYGSALSFYTSTGSATPTPTEKMRIDSSGRVTMPNQPAFNVMHNNNTATTGEIVWGTAVFNIGSYYNTSNGRFTAPVAGTYFFRAHTLTQNVPGGETRMAIYKNGVGYGGLRFITIKPANAWWAIWCEGHVYMNAGDYVSVWMEQTPAALYNDANYNSFTGHLVG